MFLGSFAAWHRVGVCMKGPGEILLGKVGATPESAGKAALKC